ncbi:hypothetical protein G3572_10170 [Rhodobacter sp. ETT8]|uniref:Transposase TnpC homeodomain domain-containing protein n=1 Tax=Pseudotabrizicola algicola TaxID=2709381 RepID=A0A6B3RKK9_9RHOB|nr:hypothetical protein [Pseudotabrizicola algicola]
METQVTAFKQAIFGRKSKKSDPDQFELALEDLETAMAEIHAEEPSGSQNDLGDLYAASAEDWAAKRSAKPHAGNCGTLRKHPLPPHGLLANRERGPRVVKVIWPDFLTCACRARHRHAGCRHQSAVRRKA